MAHVAARLRRQALQTDRWLVAIAAGALLWRLAWLGRPSLWFDEALEWYRASGPVGRALFGGPLDHDPPLLPLLYFVWTRLGDGEVWLRLPAVVAGTGAVLLTGLWATRLFGRRVGRLAALSMAVAPVQVYYGQELNQYAWVLLFTMASLLGLEDVRERGGWWDWLRYVVVAALALATYYGLVFPLAAQWLYLAWRATRRRDGRGWLWLGTYAVVFVATAATLWRLGLAERILVPHAVRRWGWPTAELEWAFFHDVFWREVVVFYLLPFSGGPALVVVRFLSLAALGGAIHLWRRYPAGPRAVTVGFLLPLLLTYVASGWALYPFGFRHGLFVTPVLLTALAGAGVWLLDRWRPAGIVAVAATMAVFLAFAPQRWWDNPWMAPPREEMRAVVAELTAERRPGAPVYVYDSARYAFQYYYSRDGASPSGAVVWGEPFEGDEVTREAARLDDTMGSDVARLWLVFSHVEGEEDTALVDALVTRGWQVVHRVSAAGAAAIALQHPPDP